MPRSDSPPVRGPSRRSPSPRRDRERDREHRSGDSRRDDRDRPREHRHRDESERSERYERDDRHRSSRDTDRERDRNHLDLDRDRDGPSRRSRSPSPSRGSTRKPKAKELSFYKKSSSSGIGSMGSFSHRRDPLDAVEESAKDRMERRERGNVPARFGGTREQGVRNTMSAPGSAPQGSSMGSLKRTADPLDRMSGAGAGRGGGGGGDADRRQQERIAAMGGSGSGSGGPGAAAGGPPSGIPTPAGGRMIEVIANDRLGKKVRVKCLPTDTVGDLKKLIAVQTGTAYQKIQLKKWYTIYKDHISLRDYEINDGMSLEMY